MQGRLGRKSCKKDLKERFGRATCKKDLHAKFEQLNTWWRDAHCFHFGSSDICSKQAHCFHSSAIGGSAGYWRPMAATLPAATPATGGTSRIVSSNKLKFDEMAGLEEFAALLEAIDDQKLVGPRQILSHHTTTACQPQKQAGPVSNLKGCGLDEKLGSAGHWRLESKMPSSFEHGDGLDVEYIGWERANFKDCQTEAAQLVHAFLFVNRPTWCAFTSEHPAQQGPGARYGRTCAGCLGCPRVGLAPSCAAS